MNNTIGWLLVGSHWTGSGGVLARLVEHLWLTGLSVGVACVIALPVALWLGHIGKGGALAINVSNVGRAVPTFAALVLLAFTQLGFGATSTIVALVLFAIPPLLTNAYVGMREVDARLIEAARGMGMSELQVLRKVELPLALPLIITGLRLCTVQVVATATIAALVAGPGLGRIITAGYGQQDQSEVVSGALLVAVLALLIEVGFAVVQRHLDPTARARTTRTRGKELQIATEQG